APAFFQQPAIDELLVPLIAQVRVAPLVEPPAIPPAEEAVHLVARAVHVQGHPPSRRPRRPRADEAALQAHRLLAPRREPPVHAGRAPAPTPALSFHLGSGAAEVIAGLRELLAG